MSEWRTLEQIEAARETIAASIEGWQPPAAFAVGVSSATSSSETEFPHVNVGTGELPAVIIAKVTGYANGTSTHELTTGQLAHAIAALEAAEACPAYQDGNLAAWRLTLEEARSNPARTLCVVFIGDLDDPVSSEADGSLRLQLPTR